MIEARQKLHRCQRWYDKFPALGMAIETMEKLPLASQISLAQAITSSVIIVEGSTLKQYGTNKILGLLKVERKLR